MKRLLIGVIATLALAGIATAKANSPLSSSYKAVYCYPTGTYWQKQVNAFPAYYFLHDAYFRSQYGPGTRYC